MWVTDGINVTKPMINKVHKLIQASGAKLTLVNVVDQIPSEFLLLSENTPSQVLKSEVIKSRLALENFAERLRRVGIPVKSKVLIGTESIEVIRLILKNKHDLLVKRSSDKGSILNWLGESNNLRLMRKCPCPVLFLKPVEEKTPHIFLAAINASPEDSEKDAVNYRILEYTRLLKNYSSKSQIHVVHAGVSIRKQC